MGRHPKGASILYGSFLQKPPTKLGRRSLLTLKFNLIALAICKSYKIKFKKWRLPIFPGSYLPSIVGDESLYDRVRDDSADEKAGNPAFEERGWFPLVLEKSPEINQSSSKFRS